MFRQSVSTQNLLCVLTLFAALHVVAEKMRARVVRITRRIHCRDPNEIRCQLHDLVRGAIDFHADAIDEGGVHDAVL